MSARIWLVGLLVCAALVAACGGGSEAGTEPPPVRSGAPTDAVAGSDAPEATDGEEATEDPSDSDAPEGSDEPSEGPASQEPGSDDPFVGEVVNTLVARLRMRAEPGTGAPLTATLPLGTALYVLDGPQDASGYAWYQVVRVSGTDDAIGWVAAADPDGEQWIDTAEAECPDAPTTFEELRGLAAGVRLACFGDTPLSVTARLTTCNCDIDAPVYEPDWFNITLFDGAPLILAEPAGGGSIDVADGLLLFLDPEGDAEDPLPLDAVVDVTGVFDHPAARTCTSTVDEGESRSDVACRFAFAVTSLRTTP